MLELAVKTFNIIVLLGRLLDLRCFSLSCFCVPVSFTTELELKQLQVGKDDREGWL